MKAQFPQLHFITIFLLLNFLFLVSEVTFAQTANIKSIYLIGDVGTINYPRKMNVLNHLSKDIKRSGVNSGVIFLGDNLYLEGLTDTSSRLLKKLNAQLNVLQNYHGYAYFVPGNHDWKHMDVDNGKEVLLQEEERIESYYRRYLADSLANREEIFYPSNGQPGPQYQDIGNGPGKVRIIMFDSQWFLQPVKGSSLPQCKYYPAQMEKFKVDLQSILTETEKTGIKNVIVAAHHPIYTNGRHGNDAIKNKDKKQKPTIQDIYHADNLLMTSTINEIMKAHDEKLNITFASGHEHLLECYIEPYNTNINYIVSGRGGEQHAFGHFTPINNSCKEELDCFKHKTGYFRVDYLEDGSEKIFICYKTLFKFKTRIVTNKID